MIECEHTIKSGMSFTVTTVSPPTCTFCEMNKIKEELARARHDRDDYQARLHSAHERLNQMTSAASGAAASTVTAINEIQRLTAVVDKAVEWRQSYQRGSLDRHDLQNYFRISEELRNLIDEHLAFIAKRS